MKFIAMFLTAFVSINCGKKVESEKLRCADFKTGKFELINKETGKKYLIERTKDYQVEQTFNILTNKKIKKDIYYKISWKNDCEYILILDTSKSQFDKTDQYINSVGGYSCLIKSVENSCATVETNVEGDIFTSKICKIQ